MMSKDAQRNLGSEQQKQNIDANQIMNTKTLQMQYKITWHKSWTMISMLNDILTIK
jgi:hypothetical protein